MSFISLDEIRECLNIKLLYHTAWQINQQALKDDLELQDELEETLERMDGLASEYINHDYVYRYFYMSEIKDIITFGDEILDRHPSASKKRVTTRVTPTIGEEQAAIQRVTARVTPTIDEEKVAIQIVTLGEKAVQKAKKLKESGYYTDYFYWHGYCAAMTEALAGKLHAKIRMEMDIMKMENGEWRMENEPVAAISDCQNNRSGEGDVVVPPPTPPAFTGGASSMDSKDKDYQGRRYSFGYEALPDIPEQIKICELLKAERIGVTATESGMLEPEYSTCAVIFFGK